MSNGKRSGNGDARKVIVSLTLLVIIELAFVTSIFIFHVPVRKPPVQVPPTVPYESMINLITWTSQNGYSSLQWNAITELSIFHVWPNANGTITYDGSAVNVPQTIAAAHSHGVKVFLAFGGAGVSQTVINNILANQTLQAIFINNLVAEMQNKSYDGIHVDFEGTFNRTQFTSFVKNLYNAAYAKKPSVLVDVQVADWESSDFNLPALEPYTTHFNVMFNPTISDMNSWAAQLQNPTKMAAGYDFQDDPETPAILLPKLQADRQADYGVFFWQAATANASYYSVIEQALGNLSTTSTSSISTSSTSISSTSISSISTSSASTTATTTKFTTSTTSTSITSTGSTTTIPAAKYANGTSIIILYPTILWQTPTNATSIGSEAVGANGIIIKQPVFDNYTKLWFYYIKFSDSNTGWVKEKQFTASTSTTTTLSSSTTSTSLTTSSASSSTSSTTAASTTVSGTTSGSTTASPTSSSTSPTTTILSITTSNSTVSVNGIISADSPFSIYLKSANSTINVTANTQTQANVVITNVTSNSIIPQLPNNALLLALKVNYTESSNSLLYTTFKTGYPCTAPSGAIYVSQLINGSWSQIPYAADSAKCSVTYNIVTDPIIGVFIQSPISSTTSAATTTISSGSGGGGGGGGNNGGGGGSSKPHKKSVQNGYIITNMTQLNTVNVTLKGTKLNITENYITPTSAGLTINGNSTYPLNLSNQYTVISNLNYSIGVKLLNISYVPIQQKIAIFVYYNSTALPNTTPTTSIRTIPSTTTTVSTTIPTTAPIAPIIGIAVGAPPSKGFTGTLYVVSGVIVAAVLTTVYFIYLRKIMGNIMLSKRHISAIYLLIAVAVLLAGIFAYSAANLYLHIRPLVPISNTTVTSTVSQSTILPGYQLVQFQEYGLPLGAKWYVQLGTSFKNGVVEQGTADTVVGHINSTTGYINFTVPPGAYYYMVKQVPGYNLVDYQFRDQGYVNISAAGYHPITGMFAKCTENCSSSTHTLSFQEFGLLHGANWSVTVDGITNLSDSLFVNFTEPLGLHNYTIIDQAYGYTAYPSSGTVNMTTESSVYSVAATFEK